MNFLETALNFIFPPVCGICGKMKESYLCKECQTKIENEPVFLNKTDDYVTKYFSTHTYLFSYTTPIREKILQYKFKEQAYLANMFSEFFVKNEKICGFLQKYDIIIPVPMTKKKVRKRGYNQSELIAKQIAKKIPNLKLESRILVKTNENRIAYISFTSARYIIYSDIDETSHYAQSWSQASNIHDVVSLAQYVFPAGYLAIPSAFYMLAGPDVTLGVSGESFIINDQEYFIPGNTGSIWRIAIELPKSEQS